MKDEPGTKHAEGTTQQQAAAALWEIATREWVEAPSGPVDDALTARLDAGEATLVERRRGHVNLYGRVGNVRYQIRLAGSVGTAHPIDGDGVIRHVRKRGQIIEKSMPLGERPVEGWGRERVRE